MSDKPLFSIVTVCRNDWQHLCLTAASVEMQSCRNYEYLIIDGASSDGTAERLDLLQATVAISEPDRGIFDAMNKALGLVRGRYVCFMNAGDVFPHSEVLQIVSNSIEQHPEVALFYGDVYYANSVRPYSLQPGKLTAFTLFRGGVCHQAWFLEKDVYDRLNGFDQCLKYKGDYDLLCRAVLALGVQYKRIPACTVDYLGGGYSERNLQEGRPEFQRVRRKYISRQEAALFSLGTALLERIQRNRIYQRTMAALYRSRARRTWNLAEQADERRES